MYPAGGVAISKPTALQKNNIKDIKKDIIMNQELQRTYTAILREELILATGCTEPIAIAYCAAVCRKLLGRQPERVEAVLSGNILKNVKSVVVPNTGGRKGIRPAIAAGMVAGDPEQELQVIAHLSEGALAEMDTFLKTTQIDVTCGASPHKLDIDLTAYVGAHTARARIVDRHTNLVYMARDGEVLRDEPIPDTPAEPTIDKSCLNVEDILDFAATVDLEEVKPLLLRQIACNSAIAEEGLTNVWGAQIGRILLDDYGDDVKQRAKAYAAAGSDARMSGCELPVVINSGSGNQGLTVSVPVAVYAEEYHKTQEELYRALVVSNLTAIHQKTTIGKLSAFCGAVTAGAGAGAGIAWLLTQDFSTVAHTIVNALAIVSGIICDGAKPSCAAKMATCLESALMAHGLAMEGKSFHGGEGIVKASVEDTVAAVGCVASQGMRQTDEVILDLMTDQS